MPNADPRIILDNTCTSCDGLGHINRQIFNKDGTNTIMQGVKCLLCKGRGYRVW